MTGVIEETRADPRAPKPHGRRLDVPLCLMLLIAAAIVIPRSLLITAAQSETFDEPCHFATGLFYFSGMLQRADHNDPPLGAAITVLPAWLAGCRENINEPGNMTGADFVNELYSQPRSVETIRRLIAVWRSLLFLGMVGVAFIWCRKLYGLAGGWMAAGLLVLDPNLTAHLHLLTLDVIALVGIVFCCYLGWEYFQRPSLVRACGLLVLTAATMLLKHTAVIVPGVLLCFAVLWWIVKPRLEGRSIGPWRRVLPAWLGKLSLAALILLLSIWALMQFEFAKATVGTPVPHGRLITWVMEQPLPAVSYFKNVYSAALHTSIGHPSFLLGHISTEGLWYYFLVIASYKVPIGILVVVVIGALSLLWRRPTWHEWPFIIGMTVWALLLYRSHINIGFRHFLPVYIFVLLFSCRMVATPGRLSKAIAILALLATALDTARFFPDYLSYTNFPRDQVYFQISDSNIDWGQSYKEVRQWLDTTPHENRPVWIVPFNTTPPDKYLGDRATLVVSERPTHGLLIITPIAITSQYDPSGTFTALRAYRPKAVIGSSTLVYDLDEIGNGKGFEWPPLKS